MQDSQWKAYAAKTLSQRERREIMDDPREFDVSNARSLIGRLRRGTDQTVGELIRENPHARRAVDAMTARGFTPITARHEIAWALINASGEIEMHEYDEARFGVAGVKGFDRVLDRLAEGESLEDIFPKERERVARQRHLAEEGSMSWKARRRWGLYS